jgi:alpha-N-arabinofuranosidase
MTTVQTINVHFDAPVGRIRPELHGHFLEHLGTATYGGIWVEPDSPIPNIQGVRKDAVEYLHALQVPVLRWPGGCYADNYHWRDGIGETSRRPRRLNLWWGNVIDNNSFGLHEFMRLCSLIDAAPYLAGNIGSGSPGELRDWVEYCNQPDGTTLAEERRSNGDAKPFRVRYWGIGNESWACGGHFTPREYAAQYARFATYVRTVGITSPYLVACGPNNNDTAWTREFFEALRQERPFRPPLHGVSMHMYAWGKSTSLAYTPETCREQLSAFDLLEHAIIEQRSYLDAYARSTGSDRIGLLVDEWGTWDLSDKDVERDHGLFWQQNTMKDGVAAALGLNVFHRHADKLDMCNIAQLANVLQAPLLTRGPFCVRTPTYYVFLMLRDHRGKTAVRADNPVSPSRTLSTSASRDDGTFAVTLVHPDPEAELDVVVRPRGEHVSSCMASILHHRDLNAHNSFEGSDTIVPQTHTVSITGGTITVHLPPLSVVHIRGRFG